MQVDVEEEHYWPDWFWFWLTSQIPIRLEIKGRVINKIITYTSTCGLSKGGGGEFVTIPHFFDEGENGDDIFNDEARLEEIQMAFWSHVGQCARGDFDREMQNYYTCPRGWRFVQCVPRTDNQKAIAFAIQEDLRKELPENMKDQDIPVMIYTLVEKLN